MLEDRADSRGELGLAEDAIDLLDQGAVGDGSQRAGSSAGTGGGANAAARDTSKTLKSGPQTRPMVASPVATARAMSSVRGRMDQGKPAASIAMWAMEFAMTAMVPGACDPHRQAAVSGMSSYAAP